MQGYSDELLTFSTTATPACPSYEKTLFGRHHEAEGLGQCGAERRNQAIREVRCQPATRAHGVVMRAALHLESSDAVVEANLRKQPDIGEVSQHPICGRPVKERAGP